MAAIIYNNLDENRFWLQIMGDGARIILAAISPDDKDEVDQLHGFIMQFDKLFWRAEQDMDPGQLEQFNQESYQATRNIRQYFLNLLYKQVIKGYFVLLKPTLINSMIDMTDQYLHILFAFIHNQQPVFNITAQDAFWLPIFISQARYISDNVGFNQTDLRAAADAYASKMQNLAIFSTELLGIQRIGETEFPIEREHRSVVENTLRDYADFVGRIMQLVQKNRMPGTLSLVYMDRSNRMLCYYLRQLATISNSRLPECDPASPRLGRG